MGMDFVALMKYDGPNNRVQHSLSLLESGVPMQILTLGQRLREREFSCGRDVSRYWEYRRKPELRDPRLNQRPVLPNLAVHLALPTGFFLTFGADAIEMYHLLRWSFFLEDEALQTAMLDACSCLGGLFGASDCIVTSDYSPVIAAFRNGKQFGDALASAAPEDGERPTIRELYVEIPEKEIMRPMHNGPYVYMDWDIDKRPPDGWERAKTWNSFGFWRYRPTSGFRAVVDPELFIQLPAQEPQIGHVPQSEWISSPEPNVMLELLLRGDRVSLRKLRLWACACLRRIWPALTSNQSQRAVERLEQFVEGEAHQKQIEELGSAVGRRHGKVNAHACRAVWLASRLSCPELSFPPGDISEAAAAAMAGISGNESAIVIERKYQADLLRDIFSQSLPLQSKLDNRWATSTVLELAQAIYNGRAFDRMPILADALMDAGCDDQQIIQHCIQQGNLHVRGCWVVDLILGQS